MSRHGAKSSHVFLGTPCALAREGGSSAVEPREPEFYYCHFMGQKTEAQSSYVACPACPCLDPME